MCRHVAKPSPEHAVVTHDNRPETDGAAVGESGQLTLVCIDDGDNLVAANPYLVTVTILCSHLKAADRFEQIVWQVFQEVSNTVRNHFGGFLVSTFYPQPFTIHITAPQPALGIFVNLRHTRQGVDALPLSCLIVNPYAARLTGINPVAIHKQGCSRIRGHPDNVASLCNLVNATRCGSEQTVVVMA